MIKFFRKIRQKAISENRISSYLIYAVGEILLVVIGILIALQINNWNQDQKEKTLSNNYLKRIVSDLSMDTSILHNKIRFGEKLCSEYLIYIKEMHEQQHSAEEYINLMHSFDANVDDLILNDIAFSELVNTGSLNLLYNPVLKDKIIRYYRHYEFVASRVDELNSSNLELLTEGLKTATSLKYILQGDQGILPSDFLKESEHMYYKSDWAYINNPESFSFRLQENTVYFYYIKQIILKPMFSELVEQANDILSILENEIQ